MENNVYLYRYLYIHLQHFAIFSFCYVSVPLYFISQLEYN